MKKIKVAGFKRKKVIVPRAKKRKKNWYVDREKKEAFVPQHVIDRHEGRRIRKAARAASKPSPLRVVK
jgi:hypothetical protein